MSAFLLVTLLLTQGSTSPCNAPEFRQFDFWVGEWIVRGPKGQQVGTNRIEKIEGGCAILENWTSARGVTGRSINIYRPASRTWTQAWAGSDGLTLILEGRFADGKMILEGKSLGTKGEPLRDRVTWSPTDDGLRQFWEQSADEGKTWTVAFDGRYSRR